MQIRSHRLVEAVQLDSPNANARPDGEISLIVLHGISLPAGEFGGDAVQSLFLNQLDTSSTFQDLQGVEVSSHLFLRRTGEVQQYVAFDRRAWHAGESIFRGRHGCNDFSIGIELEGTDDVSYEDAQYEQLGIVCTLLMTTYGITDVVGHQHVAPGRKTDPGAAFDWMRLRRDLARRL